MKGLFLHYRIILFDVEGLVPARRPRFVYEEYVVTHSVDVQSSSLVNVFPPELGFCAYDVNAQVSILFEPRFVLHVEHEHQSQRW